MSFLCPKYVSNLFIHYFEYLLGISLEPDTLSWAKDMAKKKADRNSRPHGIYTPVRGKKKHIVQYFPKVGFGFQILLLQVVY